MELEENPNQEQRETVGTQLAGNSDSGALPPGLVLLEQYSRDFYEFLRLDGKEIPRPYFLSLPPKQFKTTCVVRMSSSLLTFPVYNCLLKFDGRFVMSAQKGILGKTIISRDSEPKENANMLAKLSSNLAKDQYRLYQKVEESRLGKGGRIELAHIRYSKEADIILLPKVDGNSEVLRNISDPQQRHLENEYHESKILVTALKLHRSEFRCETLKRNYFSLRDMMERTRTNKLMLRRTSQSQWEYSFWHPLSPLQAFGIVLSVIDKGCT